MNVPQDECVHIEVHNKYFYVQGLMCVYEFELFPECLWQFSSRLSRMFLKLWNQEYLLRGLLVIAMSQLISVVYHQVGISEETVAAFTEWRLTLYCPSGQGFFVWFWQWLFKHDNVHSRLKTHKRFVEFCNSFSINLFSINDSSILCNL